MTTVPQAFSDIPRLRRFARALTGSQAAGDASIALFLEAILKDPHSLPPKARPELSAYALFCAVWRQAEPDWRGPGWRSLRRGADARLAALVPDRRIAFLLHQLEGFSIDETAAILETTPDGVEDLLDAADADIARQIATRVLIIEDEPLIALDLERLMASLGHRVVSVARTRAETAAAIRIEQPGLVLADIQLADGSSGASAVEDILEHASPAVIFITAFPERLLTGARLEPTYLLTKPYDPEAVKAMTSQALFFDGDRIPRAALA
ncbi:MAG: response regulator [Bauldia sp.]